MDMKSNLPDVAYDRGALKDLIDSTIQWMKEQPILEKGVYPDLYSPKFEFLYDGEYRECKMCIRYMNTEKYELHFCMRDDHWNDWDCLICENYDLRWVVRAIGKRRLKRKIHAVVYKWLEGTFADVVRVPCGTKQLLPILLDPNHKRWWERDNKVDENVGFSLEEYGRIGTLIIPESVDIPHMEHESPFASYKQRGFVWNHPTEWSKVRIWCIRNCSENLAVKGGVLYSADMTRLIYCFEEKERLVVPDTVTIIEPYAFCLQKRLKSIGLHDGITFIGDAAFMACQSLCEVIIPKGLKKINADTFDGCTKLSKIVLPEGLEGIGHCAFRQCRSLEKIHLPSTLKYVHGFEGCSSLKEIDIPAGVETISDFLFCSSLRKVTLHEGVKRIEGYAFRFCDNIKEINFPEGLEYIGERAFYPGCKYTTKLTKIEFPSSLQEIGCEAFYYNRRLRSVKFRSNVQIHKAAFACCSLLLKNYIHKPEDMEIKDDVFIQDKTFDKFAFWD